MFEKIVQWNKKHNNMPVKIGIVVLSIGAGVGAGFVLARALEGAEAGLAAVEIAATTAAEIAAVDMIM